MSPFDAEGLAALSQPPVEYQGVHLSMNGSPAVIAFLASAFWVGKCWPLTRTLAFDRNLASPPPMRDNSPRLLVAPVKCWAALRHNSVSAMSLMRKRTVISSANPGAETPFKFIVKRRWGNQRTWLLECPVAGKGMAKTNVGEQRRSVRPWGNPGTVREPIGRCDCPRAARKFHRGPGCGCRFRRSCPRP